MTVFLKTSIALVLIQAGGCAGLDKVDVGRVLSSGRDGWQHPEQVIEALEIEAGDKVAEIGAGEGYWLPWLSEAVGPAGRVYAVEVVDDKLEELREHVEREGLDNVVVVRGRFADPELPDGEIDLAMTCLTYHHIEGREDYFRRLRVDLAPEGRVAHLDDRPDAGAPFRWFQSSGHWSEPEALRGEMEEAGYVVDSEYDFLPAQSFQVFSVAAVAP